MKLYDKLVDKEESLALVGLGYVGMPIAVAFANKGIKVIGFDLNKAKIELYKSGVDPTNEVGDDAIKNTTVESINTQRLWSNMPKAAPSLKRNLKSIKPGIIVNVVFLGINSSANCFVTKSTTTNTTSRATTAIFLLSTLSPPYS